MRFLIQFNEYATNYMKYSCMISITFRLLISIDKKLT